MERSNDNMDIEKVSQKKDSIMEAASEDSQSDFLSFSQSTKLPYNFTFRINKSIYDEYRSAINVICSKKYHSKPKLCKKRDSNSLFVDPSNYTGQKYQAFIPNKITYSFEGIGSRLYCVGYDRKGEKVFVTSQTGVASFDIKQYDNELKLDKAQTCSSASWALTDFDFTEDGKHMIQSTFSPHVQLYDVENQKYTAQFNMDTGADEELNYFYYNFRLFSAKISSDGSQIIAGTSRCQDGRARLQFYDIKQKKVVTSVPAHENDINSVCYVDKQNPTLILTGSDDGLCKLWDSRLLNNSSKPVGIFFGHLSGITHVCSKEDNRYFITNSKDQSVKLWDLRKLKTGEEKYYHFGFDYRMEKLSSYEINKIRKGMKANPLDDSVMTFFGHQVYVTLVRCHFSPKFSTDQRYIYTGSSDGAVYIYDMLSQKLAAKLEGNEDRVIRDCAWHPTNQSLITADFSGNIIKWDYFDL